MEAAGGERGVRAQGSMRKGRLTVPRSNMPEQMKWDGGMEGTEQCSPALTQLACVRCSRVSHPLQGVVAEANTKQNEKIPRNRMQANQKPSVEPWHITFPLLL